MALNSQLHTDLLNFDKRCLNAFLFYYYRKFSFLDQVSTVVPTAALPPTLLFLQLRYFKVGPKIFELSYFSIM